MPSHARWHQLLFFLTPAVLIYSAFMVLPLLDSLRLSFFHQTITGSVSFAGLENFSQLFTNPNYSVAFWSTLLHNTEFFAIFMLIQTPIALLLATLLSARHLKGRAIYRTVLFAPATLSIVIVGWVWSLMLNPLWGIVNSMLKNVGLAAIIPKEGWLGSESWALIVVALVGVWQYVGLPMILFIAALVGIDDELIDAGRVDGASGLGIFWRIKFPLILPTLGIVTILTFVSNFSAFENVFVMTDGGPNHHTMLLNNLFYGAMFSDPNPDIGPTVGGAIFLIILTVVCIYLFGFHRRLIRD